MAARPAQAILCYVRDEFAYFTTQSLDEVWGDDFDDVPYEHNAGTPYCPCWHRQDGSQCDCTSCARSWHPDGRPKWTIYQVRWNGPFVEPREDHLNSPYSVVHINAGLVPWLRPAAGEEGHHAISIFAGTSLKEFRRLVRWAGGEVGRATKNKG